jgi:predicted phosphodiesterase
VAFLIVSDIHGNLEALEAVLADARGRYDRILCLGDMVGYGADPNAAVEWARTSVAAIVRGNHDKACTGLDSTEDYHPAAQASAVWTAEALSPANAEYLRGLPRGPLPIEGFDLVHGSPLGEDDYLIVPSDLEPLRGYLDSRLTFFGHTHVQGGFLLAGGRTRGGIKRIEPKAVLELDPNHSYLVNPGSVGQPRDRDPRAAYAIYTPADRTVEYRRVAYDIEVASRKILEAGLPVALAARLFEGA